MQCSNTGTAQNVIDSDDVYTWQLSLQMPNGYRANNYKVSRKQQTMEPIWMLFGIFCYLFAKSEAAIDRFDEELFIKPLHPSHVNTYFQFTTEWLVQNNESCNASFHQHSNRLSCHFITFSNFHPLFRPSHAFGRSPFGRNIPEIRFGRAARQFDSRFVALRKMGISGSGCSTRGRAMGMVWLKQTDRSANRRAMERAMRSSVWFILCIVELRRSHEYGTSETRIPTNIFGSTQNAIRR